MIPQKIRDACRFCMNVIYIWTPNGHWIRSLEQIVVFLFPLVVSYFKFVDPKAPILPNWLEPSLTWVQERQLVFILGIATVLAALNFLIRLLPLSPSEKRDVETLLKQCLDRHFDNPDREKYSYRATLFLPIKFPFLGKWLRAVARASHDCDNSLPAVAFSIDDGRHRRYSGIAGECWRQCGLVKTSLNGLDMNSDLSMTDYREQGKINQSEFRQIRVKSVFFLATDIRYRGKAVGVLVLDSTDPNIRTNNLTAVTGRIKKRDQEHLEQTAQSLGLLVGGSR